MPSPRILTKSGFNTQPPEGGWIRFVPGDRESEVSTHSRPKAAGVTNSLIFKRVRFNTQPPEGGWNISYC